MHGTIMLLFSLFLAAVFLTHGCRSEAQQKNHHTCFSLMPGESENTSKALITPFLKRFPATALKSRQDKIANEDVTLRLVPLIGGDNNHCVKFRVDKDSLATHTHRKKPVLIFKIRE